MSSPVDFSREERALYNPAFLALVCARVVQGHAQKHQPGCPLPLVLTASIMALQPAVRALLPRSNASMTEWAESNGAVRVYMSTNTPGLLTVVRPGLLFALQNRVLFLEAAALTLRDKAIPKGIRNRSAEATAVQKAAHMLGRWLPTGGSTATVLTLLGVRP
ncbi:three component ABC system middle component [Actinokineospora inagensis]|uniref:three component ABC system middle component n=1 Tax=Actinokineospora inagensis TaxID=103730 RepID=UPI0004798283|nr:three component ABC system middle component [Actinokineospora inagensis]